MRPQVARLQVVSGEAEQAAADSARALKAEARANHRDLSLARQELAASGRRIQVPLQLFYLLHKCERIATLLTGKVDLGHIRPYPADMP